MPVRWYDIGTVAVTAGSATVVGTGTGWIGVVHEGDIFFGPDDRPYEVAAVAGAASLTLRRPYRGATASAGTYGIVRNFDASVAGDLTGRVSDLVLSAGARDREWRDWLAGTPHGGPAGDGRYPVTAANGTVRPIMCPAKYEALASGGAADVPSITGYGADPTGADDSTAAIRDALAAKGAALVPPGTFRITDTIHLGYGQALIGCGDRSVIQARGAPFDAVQYPSYPSPFNAVELVDGYALLENLRIVGGATGVKIYGATGPDRKSVV